MSPNEQHNEPVDGVYTEASQWFVEIREGDLDASGQARFGRWLRRSPDHIRAYMEVAALWSDIPRLTAHLEVDVEAIVAHARARQGVVHRHDRPARIAEHRRGPERGQGVDQEPRARDGGGIEVGRGSREGGGGGHTAIGY